MADLCAYCLGTGTAEDEHDEWRPCPCGCWDAPPDACDEAALAAATEADRWLDEAREDEAA